MSDLRTNQPTRLNSLRVEPGGLFEECQPGRPWVGWYAAIADLIAGLPESRFAEWQLKRLPESLANSFLVMTGNTSDEQAAPGVGVLEPQRPANSVYAQPPSMRAWLVDCVHRTDAPLTARGLDEPAHTIKGSDGRRPGNMPRALLINGQNAGRDLSLCDGESRAFAVTNTAKGLLRALLIQGTSTLDTRTGECPSPAVVATVHTKAAVPKALLVSNAKIEFSDGLREAEEPAFTSTGEQDGRLRALLEQGRVVAMNARALARFQSVPDAYQLPAKNALAFRVVGNGVPSLFAQRIAESLQVTI